MNNIGWCDDTHNLITGCLNHTDGICNGGGFPCYAYKLANTRLRERYLANTHTAASQIIDNIPINMMQKQIKAELDPFYPRFWSGRLYKKFPAGSKVFLNDMGEWLGGWIPESWTLEVLLYIQNHPETIFQTLTKQPQNLQKYEYPDNCWVGVTATNYDMFVDACGHLGALGHKGHIKSSFISIEPLLSWDSTDNGGFIQSWLQHGGIDWIIIGAQTKPYKPPKIEWVQEIVEAADKAGIPVFLKDNLKPFIVKVKDNSEYAPLWANSGYGTLRQEFPK